MEIAKCPYCECGLILDGGDFSRLHYMVCDHCNAEGPKMQTRQEAIEAWNRISRIVDVHEKEEILRKAMAADMGIEYSYPIDGYIKK